MIPPMSDVAFQSLRQHLNDLCDSTMVDRSGKYEVGQDKLSFFRAEAARVGVDPVLVCWILRQKHQANIDSKVRQALAGELNCSVEDLVEPFVDLRNYDDFLLAILTLLRRDAEKDG